MSIHSFEVTKTNGTKTKLTEYKGKFLVIVNTASKCQFTPQFDDLQKLYDQYKDSGLEISANGAKHCSLFVLILLMRKLSYIFIF